MSRKNTWPELKDAWAQPDVRDAVVDYVRHWSDRTGISYRRIVQWIGIPRSKLYQWQDRYGKVNEHNAWIPRDFWLRDEEKQMILDFWNAHPGEGYRRLTYMMLDADHLAVGLRHRDSLPFPSRPSGATRRSARRCPALR